MSTTLGIEGPLLLQNIDGRRFRLVRNFSVVLQDGRTITVPRGFETDFASVPRLFWRLLPSSGEYNEAAVVHDFLYRCMTYTYTRKEADKVFLELMKRSGVSVIKRRLMYAGVRMGGWTAWRKHAPMFLLCLSIAAQGCAGTFSVYRETEFGPKVYQLSGATLGSKLPEGGNTMSSAVEADGSWSLNIGSSAKGAVAAGIPPEVLSYLVQMAISQYLPALPGNTGDIP